MPGGLFTLQYADGSIEGAPSGIAWHQDSLIALAGAPQAASAPFGYVVGGAARVVYRDVNSNITEMYLAPGQGWVQDTLSAITHAPQAASAPFGYVVGGTARVVYRDVNGNITEMYLAPGQPWQLDTLSAITQAPQAASAPMGYVVRAGRRGSSTRTSTRTSPRCTWRRGNPGRWTP